MTSRARRIVLALYGHRPCQSREERNRAYTAETVDRFAQSVHRATFGSNGYCEARTAEQWDDELSASSDARLAEIEHVMNLQAGHCVTHLNAPPRVLVGGNYGLPCA